MSPETAPEILESEWAPDSGFFWNIRQGRFVKEEYERALRKLEAISVAEGAMIPRRLVSLLWYIPTFMEWQRERVRENGGNFEEFKKAITRMTNEVERVLGVP